MHFALQAVLQQVLQLDTGGVLDVLNATVTQEIAINLSRYKYAAVPQTISGELSCFHIIA